MVAHERLLHTCSIVQLPQSVLADGASALTANAAARQRRSSSSGSEGTNGGGGRGRGRGVKRKLNGSQQQPQDPKGGAEVPTDERHQQEQEEGNGLAADDRGTGEDAGMTLGMICINLEVGPLRAQQLWEQSLNASWRKGAGPALVWRWARVTWQFAYAPGVPWLHLHRQSADHAGVPAKGHLGLVDEFA